jgi:hypothetical protein
MVAFAADGYSDLGVVIILQHMACFSHIVQFLFNYVGVLTLTNSIPEIKNASRDFICGRLESPK